jgi:hypothetical protein
MLELIEADFAGSISEPLECSSPKNIDDASGHAVGELQKVRDETLVDFSNCLFDRQQREIASDEPAKLQRFGPYWKLKLFERLAICGSDRMTCSASCVPAATTEMRS